MHSVLCTVEEINIKTMKFFYIPSIFFLNNVPYLSVCFKKVVIKVNMELFEKYYIKKEIIQCSYSKFKIFFYWKSFSPKPQQFFLIFLEQRNILHNFLCWDYFFIFMFLTCKKKTLKWTNEFRCFFFIIKCN